MKQFVFCIKMIALLAILLTFYTLSMVLIQTIPQSSVKDNVIESCEYLDNEGINKVFMPSVLSSYTALDTYTDCLFIDMAAASDSENPVESAMLNRFYSPEGSNEPTTAHTIDGANGKIELNETGWYGRCWNGHQIIIRPLLVLFNYSQIRLLNGIIFALICITLFILTYKKISKLFALFTAFFIIFFNYYLVPWCLQFSIVFYIAALSSILLLTVPFISNNIKNIYAFFFAIGSVVCFFDVFTTAYLSLGIPLLFLCIKHEEYLKWDTIIFISIFWILGYSITWAGKFIIGYELTGINILTSAMEAAKLRTSSSINGSSVSLLSMIYALRLLIVPLFMLLLYLPKYIKQVDKKKVIRYSPLLIIFFITPVWFFAMRQHSFLHIFFTYRGWILPVLTMTYFLMITKKETSD